MWFSPGSKAYDNFQTIALGGFVFAALFVIGVFVDQLNSVHFYWEMDSFAKRLHEKKWLRQVIESHGAYLGLDVDRFLVRRRRLGDRVHNWWRTDRIRFWKFFPAFLSMAESKHEEENRRHTRDCAMFLDFLLSYVLIRETGKEYAAHLLGLVERWRLCRTIGTIIFLTAIEHAGIVFWHYIKNDPTLERPFTVVFMCLLPTLVLSALALVPVLRSFARVVDALLPTAYLLAIVPSKQAEGEKQMKT